MQCSALCCVYSCFAWLFAALHPSREQSVQTDKVNTFSDEEIKQLSENLAKLGAAEIPYLNDGTKHSTHERPEGDHQ